MKLFEQSKGFLVALALVLGLVLPGAVKALTYQELLDYAGAGKTRVLGAVTPSPDIDGNGIVNSLDSALLVSHMGQNYPAADLNNDGVVNSVDLSVLSSWWFVTR